MILFKMAAIPVLLFYTGKEHDTFFNKSEYLL
jgi:hypothetical protein